MPVPRADVLVEVRGLKAEHAEHRVLAIRPRRRRSSQRYPADVLVEGRGVAKNIPYIVPDAGGVPRADVLVKGRRYKCLVSSNNMFVK